MKSSHFYCQDYYHYPDFVIAYPKKYKSYNFSRQECKKQGFSRIGGRACYFTRLFARLPKQQKQPLIIKHLQTYFEKVTKSGKRGSSGNGVMQRGHMENNLNNFYNKIQRFAGTIASSRPMQT